MAAGVIAEDGVVRCGCGKRVGKVSGEGVEFYCSRCKVPVDVQFNQMKLNALVQAMGTLQTIAAMINGLQATQTTAV